ncbi:CotH kinase family protein [Nakamurella deserti]|uniref:CotH kinase family protein n=1 Tax=Nakamurella deserti TaxID=2164074 RepID=UPI000DBE5EBF|nr:CotH kinase family protein [Nakamurella deserti]
MTVRQLRRATHRVAAGATVLVLLVACGTAGDPTAVSSAVSSTSATGTATATPAAGSGVFDSSTVHSISVEYDQAAYDAMMTTFTTTGEKEWITATVTIDGTVFTDVGIKLKGNSSLRGLQDGGGGRGGTGGDLSADAPEGLPWRIRLDKYVDGQNYQGQTDLVIRGTNTETSLNEAVALELLGVAGLATEGAASTRFWVNGGTQALRLVIQNPGETWDEENFDTDGVLYKSEAEGDWSYRGDDPTAYAEAFSVEASTSGEDDYTPLVSFLEFVNESDDATFATELSQHLDVDAFATYLAVQTLVANADDIDGPGNNSYLRWDAATGVFTVVAWDQNLSFGGMGGGAGGGMGGGGMRPRPDRATATDGSAAGTGDAAATPPADGESADGGVAGGMGGPRGGNVLSERFFADTAFAALYDAAVTQLTADYADGTAQSILDSWTAVLTGQAGDLVATETVDSEAATIAEFFTAS